MKDRNIHSINKQQCRAGSERFELTKQLSDQSSYVRHIVGFNHFDHFTLLFRFFRATCTLLFQALSCSRSFFPDGARMVVSYSAFTLCFFCSRCCAPSHACPVVPPVIRWSTSVTHHPAPPSQRATQKALRVSKKKSRSTLDRQRRWTPKSTHSSYIHTPIYRK